MKAASIDGYSIDFSNHGRMRPSPDAGWTLHKRLEDILA
jgi:hypothetical protein